MQNNGKTCYEMLMISKEMNSFISCHKRWKLAHSGFVEN